METGTPLRSPDLPTSKTKIFGYNLYIPPRSRYTFLFATAAIVDRKDQKKYCLGDSASSVLSMKSSMIDIWPPFYKDLTSILSYQFLSYNLTSTGIFS